MEQYKKELPLTVRISRLLFSIFIQTNAVRCSAGTVHLSGLHSASPWAAARQEIGRNFRANHVSARVLPPHLMIGMRNVTIVIKMVQKDPEVVRWVSKEVSLTIIEQGSKNQTKIRLLFILFNHLTF